MSLLPPKAGTPVSGTRPSPATWCCSTARHRHRGQPSPATVPMHWDSCGHASAKGWRRDEGATVSPAGIRLSTGRAHNNVSFRVSRVCPPCCPHSHSVHAVTHHSCSLVGTSTFRKHESCYGRSRQRAANRQEVHSLAVQAT